MAPPGSVDNEIGIGWSYNRRQGDDCVHRRLAIAALLVAAGLAGGCAAGRASWAAPETRTIYMSTVEYKGSAAVDDEPFPAHSPPPGGGYALRGPADGRWASETYRFEPGMIVVNQGDTVELKIWGVNGASHTSVIEGYGTRFTARRGRLTTVTFTADKAGIFRIVCHDHRPSMEAQLLVLPRK